MSVHVNVRISKIVYANKSRHTYIHQSSNPALSEPMPPNGCPLPHLNMKMLPTEKQLPSAIEK